MSGVIEAIAFLLFLGIYKFISQIFLFKICIRAREPKFDGTLKSVPKIKSVLKSVPLSALFYAEKQSKVHLDTFFQSKKIFFCNLSQNLIVQFFLPHYCHNVDSLLPTYLQLLQFFVIVCQPLM